MKVNAQGFYIAVGRRKHAIARVRMTPGTGKMVINSKDSLEYLKKKLLQMDVEQPLTLTENIGKFDIFVTVNGGGLSGQAGAARLGIARALVAYDESLKSILKSKGFMTRDSRMKERKKYGLAGARRKFQFSKR